MASSFAIPSLGMVAPAERTEALRGLMKPLLTGPLADIMNNMCPGGRKRRKGRVMFCLFLLFGPFLFRERFRNDFLFLVSLVCWYVAL